MTRQRQKSKVCAVLCFVLAGCSGPEDDALPVWMEKVRHEAAPAPAPAPDPLLRRPVVYHPADYQDPFDATKITAFSGAPGSGPQPDLKRAQEPLESYPLDSLRMVGSLLKHGQAVALVQADKLIYQVRTGHHLGQDQGKVIRISDTTIEIEEIVQESAGTWTTRTVQLSMQGKK
ncbi:MAG: pilus assembly protein PilP [Oxalobacteraceae bacterium]